MLHDPRPIFLWKVTLNNKKIISSNCDSVIIRFIDYCNDNLRYMDSMKIVNVICSGDLGQKINLNSLLQICGEKYHYDPEIYPAGYICLPNCKITIYSSGKYIIVGLKSLEHIESTFLQLLTILSHYLSLSSLQKPTIQNIVATDTIEKRISLKALYSSFSAGDTVKYEPKRFPALIYKTNGVTTLIFSSGKLVIMGAKSELTIQSTLQKIKKICKNYTVS